jgi:hypothetical protein
LPSAYRRTGRAGSRRLQGAARGAAGRWSGRGAARRGSGRAGEDAFLLAFAVDAQPAALGVEVAEADAGELGAAEAELEQAEQAEAVAGLAGGQQEAGVGVEGEDARDFAFGARPADPGGRD